MVIWPSFSSRLMFCTSSCATPLSDSSVGDVVEPVVGVGDGCKITTVGFAPLEPLTPENRGEHPLSVINRQIRARTKEPVRPPWKNLSAWNRCIVASYLFLPVAPVGAAPCTCPYKSNNTSSFPCTSSGLNVCQFLQAQVFDGLLAQDKLLHLATGGERICIDEQEIAGRFLVADASLAEVPQFLLGQFLAVARAHRGYQFLAKKFIGDAEYLHIGNFGMPDEKLFDLGGEDVFAAANDHIFQAPNNVDIALGIHGGEIAGMQPALAIDRFGSLFGHLVVALHRQETTAAELAALATGNNLLRNRVDNLDLDMRQRCANRCRF